MRTDPPATEQDMRAIAHLVARITGWDTAGIVAMLRRSPGRQVGELAVASLVAAVTRDDQTTPAVLAMPGDHQACAARALRTTAPTPEPPRAKPLPRCIVCGQPRVRHTIADDHGYTDPDGWTGSSPDVIRAARTKAGLPPHDPRSA